MMRFNLIETGYLKTIIFYWLNHFLYEPCLTLLQSCMLNGYAFPCKTCVSYLENVKKYSVRNLWLFVKILHILTNGFIINADKSDQWMNHFFILKLNALFPIF